MKQDLGLIPGSIDAKYNARIDELLAANTRLHNRIIEADNALEPFIHAAQVVFVDVPPDLQPDEGQPMEEALFKEQQPTVAHLRAALTYWTTRHVAK